MQNVLFPFSPAGERNKPVLNSRNYPEKVPDKTEHKYRYAGLDISCRRAVPDAVGLYTEKLPMLLLTKIVPWLALLK